jgi:hypothetical protein
VNYLREAVHRAPARSALSTHLTRIELLLDAIGLTRVALGTPLTYIVLIFPHIRCHRSLLGKLPSRTSARQRLILDDSDSVPMGTEMVT